jgi:photosystem II stability/assembly factor-like uncharacterized protein
VVTSGSSGARFFTYASVIDNRTGDPVQVVPVEPPSTTGAASLESGDSPDQVGDVRAIVFEEQTPGAAYAAVFGRGVFSSRDAGARWRETGTGLSDLTVQALAAAPGKPGTIYAGTGYEGVFVTRDGGLSWSRISAGLDAPDVRALAVDPTRADTLWAGTAYGGVYKSTDGGQRWRAVNDGLTGKRFVQAMAIDPDHPDTVFVGTRDTGVFRTTDGGERWTAVNAGLGSLDVRALAVDPHDSATLLAGTFGRGGGVFKSTDSGASWAPASAGLTGQGRYIQALAFDPSSPSVLIAASYGSGTFRSRDGGATWTPWSAGLTGQYVRAVAVESSGAHRVLAATQGAGVFVHELSDSSWTAVNTGLEGGDLHVWALAVDPSDPDVVYAGTYGGGLLKTTDGGLAWSALGSALGGLQVTALAVLPSSPHTVLAATWGGGVRRSVDGGVTWTAANTGLTTSLVLALAIGPGTPGTVWAGTSGGGVFKSADGGATWVASNTGLSGASLIVRTIAVDPTNPRNVFIGGDAAGVYKSTDGGANWAAANTGLVTTSVFALAIDPLNPTTLYAGAWGGVGKSVDGGANWTDSSTGLTSHVVRALLVNPANPAMLIAGTATGGVNVSTDSGATWADSSTGMAGLAMNVRSLGMTATSLQLVFAGTEGGGVYRRVYGACVFTLNPTSAIFDSTGGTGSVAVTTSQGCEWTATTTASWITLNAPSTGVNDGVVTFSVAANTDAASRTGTVSIGGQAFTVSQAGSGCVTTAAPALSVPARVGSGSSYTVSWNAVGANVSYELEEGADAAFTGATPVPVTGTSKSFAHTVTAPTTFYYRVRSVLTCGSLSLRSAWSATATTAVIPLGTVLYLPAAAHSEGTGGTVWRTDLEVHNPGTAQVPFTLAMLARDQTNTSPAVASFTLDPGKSVRLVDVLHDPAVGFGVASGAATLTVVPVGGSLLATARTYNDQPTGTYGQFIPSQAQAQAISYGHEGRLVMLAQSATAGAGFRTNLGMVNVTDKVVIVEIKLHAADGTQLGTRNYQLRAYEYKQADQIFAAVTSADVGDGYAVLSTPTGGGAFLAYASVIDNRSGDPMYVVARLVR